MAHILPSDVDFQSEDYDNLFLQKFIREGNNSDQNPELSGNLDIPEGDADAFTAPPPPSEESGTSSPAFLRQDAIVPRAPGSEMPGDPSMGNPDATPRIRVTGTDICLSISAPGMGTTRIRVQGTGEIVVVPGGKSSMLLVT